MTNRQNIKFSQHCQIKVIKRCCCIRDNWSSSPLRNTASSVFL